MEIIEKLEVILKENINAEEFKDVQLADHGNIYHQYYFNYLNDESQINALKLYESSTSLINKFQEVKRILNTGFADLNVQSFSKSLSVFLTGIIPFLEDEEIRDFLNSDFKIEYVADTKEIPEVNLLHKSAYSALGEILAEYSPIADHFEVLYEWSINATRWLFCTAFLLSEYLENEDLTNHSMFFAGFEFYKFGVLNKYWIKNNDLKTRVVCWSDQ